MKVSCYALLVFLGGMALGSAQQSKPRPPFQWVNPSTEERLKRLNVADRLRHGTFKSPSMGFDVGYNIYLPPGYGKAENRERRYPVVYHLHGGRPGSESKSIALSRFVDEAIREGQIQPTIYVFPNGGPMSWYDYPPLENGSGETVFVKELIPHIDSTYRTRAERSGRALEGFSQGGRGTTRIMFKHPELFGSVAPGGSGYEPEKRIQENEGWESEKVRFLPLGYNAWDLAARFAERKGRPELPILLWVGTKGFNYEYNLKYSDYLNTLGIPHQKLVVEGIDHSAFRIYEKQGLELMKFHQRVFNAGSSG